MNQQFVESLKKAEDIEQVEAVLKEYLNIGFTECAEILSKSLHERAEQMAPAIINIAPYNDYDKMLEKQEDILKFLIDESTKLENWKFQLLDFRKEKNSQHEGLFELLFFNKSVDGGDMLKGFVFIGTTGKVRHAFVQMDV